jgi:transcriptional regulator ATRX
VNYEGGWVPKRLNSEMSNIDHSGNLVLLVEILRNCELVGDKLLFSSQSITTLEKEFLTMEDSKSRN